MKRALGYIHTLLTTFGLNGLMLVRQTFGIPRYIAEARRFRAALAKLGTSGWKMGAYYPILTDRAEQAGVMSGHYFHMDLWMAQQVVAAKPKTHLDIGSRLDGFVAHVAASRPVVVGDIRPVVSQHPAISFTQLNLMDTAQTCTQVQPFPSVSCLHTLEHMGLGRYGDPIDPLGDVKALETLAALTEKGGTFYFATPFGRERIEFNAHRVYGLPRLLRMLNENGFSVQTFAYIDDQGNWRGETALTEAFIAQSQAFTFSCACFVCVRNG